MTVFPLLTSNNQIETVRVRVNEIITFIGNNDDASEIYFQPSGDIVANNVQDAIEEVNVIINNKKEEAVNDAIAVSIALG